MPRVDQLSAATTGDPGTAAAAPRPTPSGRVPAAGLSLAPFRGLRYAPERVKSLAAVTSPPYDVVDPDSRASLETADPHNIVRLILPSGSDAVDGYRNAAALLARWRREGVLRPDPEPALYVYEQRVPAGEVDSARAGDGDGGGTAGATAVVQRGLIGALAVTGPEAGIVLPHEDVMPRPVADRVGLMRSTRANLEPLLLTYQGGGAAAEVVERAAAGPPLLSTTTVDGTCHRLWAVTDRCDQAAVADDLSTCRALIADGHHRWAMYRRLQHEHRYLARSPWERGLVLLVDTARYPLQVRAIHRVLRQLPPDRALAAVAGRPGWTVSPLTGSPAHALARLAEVKETPGPDAVPANAFVLTDGERHHLISARPEDLPAEAFPAGRPAAWRQLDAAVLHALLLDRVWRVPDAPEHIGYLHDLDGAVREARRTGGTAVLMHPVAEAIVRELAEQGVTMPRKSTSFGPKPATGLVLRSIDLDPGCPENERGPAG